MLLKLYEILAVNSFHSLLNIDLTCERAGQQSKEKSRAAALILDLSKSHLRKYTAGLVYPFRNRTDTPCVCMVKAFAKTLLAMQVERAYKREQEKAAAKAEKDAAKAQRHR